MNDKITEMFFEPERWRAAIAKGVLKDIRKDQLYQLTKPEVRIALYRAIVSGGYRISPPHTAQIPKDTPGEFRTVYVNEPMDRIVLSIANDLLFELCPDMVHPSCRSYLKGTGCGKVVREASRRIAEANGAVIGWKSDLSKYFDSVPVAYVDAVFDDVESRHGHSALIDVLRDYYHTDLYFDENNELREQYQSLKQGCAVAAFLADAVLYKVDSKLSGFGGMYVRYSDDMLFIGDRYGEAMDCLVGELGAMGMKLNPKKVEYLSSERWFKFLGFSIKGSMLSLSSTRIKKFQKEVERLTEGRGMTMEKAVHAVNRYMYKGNGEFSWATQILPVVNVKRDIDTLNAFVMDRIRSAATGKRRTGGNITVLIGGDEVTVGLNDDPVVVKIVNGGTIPDRSLFRRWVMSQMFHMLTMKDYRTKQYIGFTAALRRYGYEYQWKMMENELKAQARMLGKDVENFADRNRWFNKNVAVAMCSEYMNHLRSYVDGLKVKHCKGMPYKHIGGRNIFVSDIQMKVFLPLWSILRKMERSTTRVPELYSLFCDFRKRMVKLPGNTPQSEAWIDAYKGCGAFYTMKNLILFHDCRFKTGARKFETKERSMGILKEYARDYAREGWKLLGVMRELIEDNGIDIEAKIAEWRNNK